MAKYNLESIIREFLSEQAIKKSVDKQSLKMKRKLQMVQSEAFDKNGKFPKKDQKDKDQDFKKKPPVDDDEDQDETKDVGHNYDPRVPDEEKDDFKNKKKSGDGESRFDPQGDNDEDDEDQDGGEDKTRFKDNDNDDDDNMNPKDNDHDEDDEDDEDQDEDEDPRSRFLKKQKKNLMKKDDDNEIDGTGEKTPVDLHPKLNTDQKSDQMTIESTSRFIRNRKVKKIPRVSGYPGSAYNSTGGSY